MTHKGGGGGCHGAIRKQSDPVVALMRPDSRNMNRAKNEAAGTTVHDRLGGGEGGGGKEERKERLVRRRGEGKTG